VSIAAGVEEASEVVEAAMVGVGDEVGEADGRAALEDVGEVKEGVVELWGVRAGRADVVVLVGGAA